MAYVSPFLTEKEKAAAEGGRPTSGIIGANTAPSGAGAPAPTAAPGTGFVNLNQYLDKNQAQGAANAKVATAGANQAADSFVGDLNKAKTTALGTIRDDAASQATAADNVVKTVKSDASSALPQAQDFLGRGTYENQGAVDSVSLNAAPVADTLKSTTTAEGVQTGLADANKDKPYSTGFGLLDSFLARGTAGGQKQISNTAGRAEGVTKSVDLSKKLVTDAVSGVNSTIGKGKEAIVAAAGGTKDRVLKDATKAADQLNATIDPRAQGANKAEIADVLARDETKAADLSALDQILKASGNYGTADFSAGALPAAAAQATPAVAAARSGSNSLPPAIAAVTDTAEKVAAVGGDIGDTSQAIGMGAQRAPGTIATAVGEATTAASRLPDGIVPALKNAPGALTNVVKGLPNAAKTVAKSVGGALDAATKLPAGAVKAGENVAKAVTKAVPALKQIPSAAKVAADAAKAKATKLALDATKAKEAKILADKNKAAEAAAKQAAEWAAMDRFNEMNRQAAAADEARRAAEFAAMDRFNAMNAAAAQAEQNVGSGLSGARDKVVNYLAPRLRF